MMHECVGRPKAGWSCVFLEWLQWSIQPQMLNVVWRGLAWCSVE